MLGDCVVRERLTSCATCYCDFHHDYVRTSSRYFENNFIDSRRRVSHLYTFCPNAPLFVPALGKVGPIMTHVTIRLASG
jgi:hypothetical protein